MSRASDHRIVRDVAALLCGGLLVLGAAVVAPAPAGAIGAPNPDIVIDFEGDALGAKPNGFTSVASGAVRFSDTIGADLSIDNAFGQGEGTRSLVVRPDSDRSGLRISLDSPTTRISLNFGNDDPGFTDPGDEAVLKAFRGSTQVGEARVVMNRNDLMDQTISFGRADGPIFSRIVFDMDVSGQGLIEVVDHIVIAPLCTVAGDENANTLTGTSGDDVLCGSGGNDRINAGAGNDQVLGGLGNDVVTGGAGDDFLAGNSGGDTISGGTEADRIEGGKGNDALSGRAGDDVLKGGTGTDSCNGGPDTDTAGACETVTNVP